MNNYFQHCDRIVSDWMNPGFLNSQTCKNDPFLSIQKSNRGLLQQKYLDLMPELFWGDPDDNVAVMLNLNPGFGTKDVNHIGKKKVSNILKNGYSSFAKTSPYFTDPHFHPDATNWWEKRYAWLTSLFGNHAKYPFVLELCPWHSHNWSEAGISQFTQDQISFIDRFVLDPAYKAVQNSISGLVISVGKKYTEIYPQLGFHLEKEWGPEMSIPGWPLSNKTKKEKNVHFLYYSKTIQTDSGAKIIKVLSIWLWGSNKTPCSEFLPIEKDIIQYVQTH